MASPLTVSALLELAPADAPALGAPDRSAVTYGELRAIIDEVGSLLRQAGVARTDRVGIVVRNGPEMAAAFLAVSCHAVAAPLNPAYRADDFRFYLADLDARLVVVDGQLASPVRDVAMEMGVQIAELRRFDDAGERWLEVPPRNRPEQLKEPEASKDDIALVLHTSGTTSRPKMVPLSHANLCASAANIAGTLALDVSDRCLNVMPLYHIHGLMAAVMATVAARGEVICTPGFDREQFFPWLAAHDPSWYTAVPTIHQAVLAAADQHREVTDAARLRFVRSSSASLPPSVMDALEQLFGAPVIEAYGMTEAAHQIASNPLPPGKRVAGSVGRAAGSEVALMDAAGRLVARGERGEIVIRGANVTAGYQANDDANALAFTNGWFRTGDEGVLDDDGYLRITGRLKEMINRGGEKVTPREVDEALVDHPHVSQAVAFAMPHPTLGEDLAVAVVLADDTSVTEDELRAFCFERLAAFKVPSRIVVVDAIPKGPTGKLQRIGLGEILAEDLAVEFDPPTGEIEAAVAAAWGEVLGIRLGRHDNFFFAGGDSLLAIEAVERLASLAADDLEPVDVFRAPTVAGFAAVLDGRGASSLSGVVELRGGTGTPVFFVPGHGGDPFTFVEIVRALRTERPLLCLELPPELRSREPTVESLANGSLQCLADDMYAQMQEIQPAGPYAIVGYCFGADLAHEIIRRIEHDRKRGTSDVGAVTYVHWWSYDRPGIGGAAVRFRRNLRRRARVIRDTLRRVRRGPEVRPIVLSGPVKSEVGLVLFDGEPYPPGWTSGPARDQWLPGSPVAMVAGRREEALTAGASDIAAFIDERLDAEQKG